MSLEHSSEEQRNAFLQNHLGPDAVAKYQERFPLIPRERIEEVVGRYSSVAREATVLEYIPILIEKEIKG